MSKRNSVKMCRFNGSSCKLQLKYDIQVIIMVGNLWNGTKHSMKNTQCEYHDGMWTFLHIAFSRYTRNTKYGFIIIARYSLTVTISSIKFEIGKTTRAIILWELQVVVVFNAIDKQTFRCYQISIVYKKTFHLDMVQWFEHWTNTRIHRDSSGEVWRSK